MSDPPRASTSQEPYDERRVPSLTLRRPVSTDSIQAQDPVSSKQARRRHLRSSSSSSSLGTPSSMTAISQAHQLRSVRSFTNLRRPSATKLAWNQPTLAELMRVEERELQFSGADRGDSSPGSSPTVRRTNLQNGDAWREWKRASNGSFGDDRAVNGNEGAWPWDTSSQNNGLPPESAVLYPPLYGRPAPSPSPDIFATLLQPILSLSRPSSPGPPSPGSEPPPPTEEPADRSASSLPAHFPPRAESDPAPTVESQGFVLYVGSLMAYVMFLVWSLCPDEWLERLGIEWYPSREWALLVPAWTVMLVFFTYFAYAALNIFITPDLDSLHTLIDHAAYILPQHDADSDVDGDADVDDPVTTRARPHPLLAESVYLPEDAVPPLHDLPIGIVNRVVLGDFRRRRVG